jgi:DNA-binding transcriptional LysR family regulator
VRFEALAEHSFVELTPERSLRKLSDQIFNQHRLQRSIVYEVSDIETLLHFVSKGLGVAIMPLALARFYSVSHNLHVLKIVSQGPGLPKWRVVILTRPRRKDLPGKTTAELFLEMLAGLSG